MKNITLLVAALVLIGFSSCKKAYSCECTTTLNYVGTTPDTYGSKTTTYSEKMTKKQAQSACDHEAVTIKSNFNDVITQAGATGFVTPSTACTLK